MEQLAQQLQQVNNAVANINREILKAQGTLATVTDAEKQAILARLYADRETVREIIKDAITALNKGILGQLEGIDKGLSNCERMITE